MVKCIHCNKSCYFVKCGELFCSKYKKIISSPEDVCNDKLEELDKEEE